MTEIGAQNIPGQLEEMRIREETNEKQSVFVSVKLGCGIAQLIIRFLPPPYQCEFYRQ